jgi:Protein of unknown function DUF262
MMIDRIMPPRWFVGHAYSSHVSNLLEVYGGVRPLEAGEKMMGRFILPAFQRGLVWTVGQKARLIESIYAGIPIGAIVWNQTTIDNQCDGWLLDGQQRTSAIMGFVTGEFAVCGWRYPDLPGVEQRHFRRMTISLIETNETDPARCREIYDRLVYGGTPHPVRSDST